MDHSTAVLDEAYGTRTDLGLNHLNLKIRRVYSNLHSQAFRDALPYVPSPAGFSVDPNLLPLLVEPLYGNEPGVSVRELVQNAVDAVCELEVWCKNHNVSLDSIELPNQDTDVLVDFIKNEDGRWLLRVTDRGIGMSSNTIQNYFLRAGASFRNSQEWAKEFLDEKAQPKVIRSGRFGIGAFAIFILGAKFRLETRHASTDKSSGFKIEASSASQLIEIRRADNLCVGTRIEIELSDEAIRILEQRKWQRLDWFCLDWPKVEIRLTTGNGVKILPPRVILPLPKGTLPAQWSKIHPPGFDAVYWTSQKGCPFTCNGMRIEGPYLGYWDHSNYYWPPETQLLKPGIAVIDSAGKLPLTLQRYDLSHNVLPFTEDLARDTMLSFIAHALVCGPETARKAITNKQKHPLGKSQSLVIGNNFDFESLFLNSTSFWLTSSTHFVPGDPYLFSILNLESCLVIGRITDNPTNSHKLDEGFYTAIIDEAHPGNETILCLEIEVGFDQDLENVSDEEHFATQAALFLELLTQKGITSFFGQMESLHAIVAERLESSYESFFEYSTRGFWNKTSQMDSQMLYFERKPSNSAYNRSLKPIIRILAANSKEGEIIFVSEFRVKREETPKSMIANLWIEFLGPKAIPYDISERKTLISEACERPELKRHIESWQELKKQLALDSI